MMKNFETIVCRFCICLGYIHLRRAQRVRNMLEKSKWAKLLLFLITILGTSMVIGDGVLTPCISVLSAVSGIKQSAKSLNQDAIVGISTAILILLFSAQRFGTDKVGYTFSPIICLWFDLINGIGLYNLFKFDVSVLRAFNPNYVVDYLTQNGKEAWVSLGGIAVVAVMIITTFMVSLIMLIIWKTSILWIALFFVVFDATELVYFSSILYKFAQGGFLPLAFSLVLMVIMSVWHYVLFLHI